MKFDLCCSRTFTLQEIQLFNQSGSLRATTHCLFYRVSCGSSNRDALFYRRTLLESDLHLVRLSCGLSRQREQISLRPNFHSLPSANGCPKI